LKKISFFLLSLIAGSAIVSTTTFEREYDFDGNADMANDVVETADGGYVLVGTTGPQDNVRGNYEGLIFKINSVGDTVWSHTYGGYGTDAFVSILLCPDSGFVVTGAKFVPSSSFQGWLMRLNKDGLPIFEKLYGGTRYAIDALGQIARTGDGGYIVIGATESFGTNGTKDAWVIRLDENFDTLWTKAYDMGAISDTTSFDDNGYNIIPFQNGNFLLTINTCTENCYSNDPRVYASYLLIDSLGNVLKHFSIKGGPKNRFHYLSPDIDNGAIITGSTSKIDSAIFLGWRSEDIWIVKLDENADTIWSKIIGQYAVYDGGYCIYPLASGGYIMSAYSQMGATPEMDYDNFWLMRLDSFGDTIWVRKWGGPYNDDMYKVIPTSDGGILSVGFRDANSNWLIGPIPGPADVWVIKTDSNGIILSATPEPELPKRFVLYQNYPNPFNSATTISFSIPVACENVKLEVFDILGRTIATILDGRLEAGNYSFTFDAREIRSGLYFYRLNAKGTKDFSCTREFVLIK